MLTTETLIQWYTSTKGSKQLQNNEKTLNIKRLAWQN